MQNLPYLYKLIQHSHAITAEPAQAELDCDKSTEVNCNPITIELNQVDHVMSNTESAPTKPAYTKSALTESTLAKPVNQREPVNQCKKQTLSKPTSKSFEHWYAAFGHINSSVFKHQVYYKDGFLLPSPPQKYDCEVYLLAKSTHHVPSAATTIGASTPLELIHSDLSGKMAVPLLGGSYYYLSLIDDYMRFA